MKTHTEYANSAHLEEVCDQIYKKGGDIHFILADTFIDQVLFSSYKVSTYRILYSMPES